MKKAILILAVALIALLSGIGVRMFTESMAQTSSQTILPEFSLPDVSGKPHNIKEWHGKVLVINFWATWCPPCLKEMPEFAAMHSEYSAKGLQFIGIALDDSEPVKEFIEKMNINYPILIGQDQGTKLAHDLGNVVDTVPFTLIVNKKGQLIKAHMGELHREELLKIVKPLL